MKLNNFCVCSTIQNLKDVFVHQELPVILNKNKV